jgi:hypothetical protein
MPKSIFKYERKSFTGSTCFGFGPTDNIESTTIFRWITIESFYKSYRTQLINTKSPSLINILHSIMWLNNISGFNMISRRMTMRQFTQEMKKLNKLTLLKKWDGRREWEVWDLKILKASFYRHFVRPSGQLKLATNKPLTGGGDLTTECSAT